MGTLFELVQNLIIFFLCWFSVGIGAGQAGAGAASHCGSGSAETMQFLAPPAPQHRGEVS
jgi:hypothetical protein